MKDAPDSPKDESHGTLESGSVRGNKEGKRQSRHLLFTTHFPLPQVRISFGVGLFIRIQANRQQFE